VNTVEVSAMQISRGEDPAILGALWLVNFASTSQVLLVSPLLPRIGEELDIEPAWRGTLIGAYGLMAACSALVAGPISDRVGRRKILLVGTAWMVVALGLHALATSFGALLAVRAAAGMAGGILAGASVAYVGDYFPYERRGRANGWVMSGFALGQVAGIPIGTLLGGRLGFRVPFVGFAVMLLLAWLLIWRFLPAPPVALARELGLGSAFRKYRALLLRPDTRAAAAMYLLTFVGVSLHIAYLPSWLEQQFVADADQIASLFLVGGAAATVTNPLAGRLSDRYGRKILILAAAALFALASASTPYLVRSFAVAYPVFFFTMVAASLRIPPTQSLVSGLVPAEERGSLLSLGSALGQGGFALGGALAGLLFERLGYAACTWAATASILATAAVVALAVRARSR
jgi:predicted MFS family arabinose efflux permease